VRVLFSLLPGVGDMKKLKVDLSLREEDKGWTIFLTVEDREPKDDAQLAVSGK